MGVGPSRGLAVRPAMTTDRQAVGTGLLLVLVTALVSGLSTFVNIYAVKGTSSDAFVTVRNLVVAAMILPMFALTAGRRLRRSPIGRTDLLRLGLIGLLGGAIPFLLFFHGLQLAAAQHGGTTASFFYRTLFLLAAVFAWVFLRERPNARYVAGAVVLLAGSYLLLSLNSAVLTDGTVYVLAATVLWAAEYTLSKATLSRLAPSTVALGRMGFGGLFLAAYLGVTAQWGLVGRFSYGQWEWVGISAALLAAFVATWYAGLARVELGVATSVLVLGYPVTWLLFVAVGAATFSTEEAAGAVAVLAGVGLVVGLSRLRASWAWLRRAKGLRGSPD